MALTITAVTPVTATTAFATIYTVPAGTTCIVKEMICCNTDTSARQLGINFIPSGGSAGVTNTVRAYSSSTTIAAGDTETWNMDTALTTGDFIQIKADANSVVSFRVSVGQIT